MQKRSLSHAHQLTA